MESLQGIEDFVNYVVATLAAYPEDAQVNRREAGAKHVFDIKLNDEDVPKLLGRSGNTVTAVRNLAIAAGEHLGVDVGVEIIEEGSFRRREDDFRDRRSSHRGDGARTGRRQRRF